LPHLLLGQISRRPDRNQTPGGGRLGYSRGPARRIPSGAPALLQEGEAMAWERPGRRERACRGIIEALGKRGGRDSNLRRRLEMVDGYLDCRDALGRSPVIIATANGRCPVHAAWGIVIRMNNLVCTLGLT
jgi:hypothetical protein